MASKPRHYPRKPPQAQARAQPPPAANVNVNVNVIQGPAHVDLKLPKGSLSMCLNYGRGGQVTCRSRECALHICHAYLAGACRMGANCPLSHNVMSALHCIPRTVRDNPPLKDLERIGCPMNMRDILASTFPRVCSHYNTKRGCQRKYCTFIHVCQCLARFDQGLCNSKLNHNMFTPKIAEILKKHKLPGTIDFLQVVRTNLLCADGPWRKGKRDCNCARPVKQKREGGQRRPRGKRGSTTCSEASQSQVDSDSESESDSDNETASVLSFDDDVDLYGAPVQEEKIMNNLSAAQKRPNQKVSVPAIEFREKVRDYLLNQGGLVKFDKLVREMSSQFPSGVDFAEQFKNDKDSFRLTVSEGSIREVASREDVRLCTRYNSDDGCPNVASICPYLHVCTDFVAGNFVQGCKKTHNLGGPNVKRIFSKQYIEVSDAKILLQILRNCWPQVCARYNEEAGQCPFGDQCRHLHVCEDALFGTCKKKNCINHSVTSQQCSPILTAFRMSGWRKDRMITVVLPYKRQNQDQRRRHGSGDSCTSGSSSQAGSGRVPPSPRPQANVVPPLLSMPPPPFHATSASGLNPALVNEARQYLLEQGGFTGVPKFTNDMKTRGHVREVAALMDDRAFVVRTREGKPSEIGVICHGVRICGKYNNQNCPNRDCGYLHLCKNYIADNCAPGCQLSHNLKDAKCKELFEKWGVHIKVPQKILYVLRNSLPQICRMYNEDSCKFGDECRFLHICEDKFFRSCPRSNCRNHDIRVSMCRRVLKEYRLDNWENVKLRSVVLPCKRASPVKAEASQDAVDEPVQEAKQNKPSNQTGARPKVPSQQSTTPVVESDDYPPRAAEVPTTSSEDVAASKEDVAAEEVASREEVLLLIICEEQLRRRCRGGCGMLHHSMPYSWQYQSGGSGGTWQEFSPDDGTDIEKTFCDASKDKWASEITLTQARRHGYPFHKQSVLNFSVSSAGVALTFNLMTWARDDSGANQRIRVPVRRLGTVSYIDAKPTAISTRWRWYYKDDETMWTQPEESLQNQCEEAYLDYSQSAATAFLTLGAGGAEACVDFESMKLFVDSAGHEDLELRRRPEFISEADLEARISGRFMAPIPTQSAAPPAAPPATPPAEPPAAAAPPSAPPAAPTRPPPPVYQRIPSDPPAAQPAPVAREAAARPPPLSSRPQAQSQPDRVRVRQATSSNPAEDEYVFLPARQRIRQHHIGIQGEAVNYHPLSDSAQPPPYPGGRAPQRPSAYAGPSSSSRAPQYGGTSVPPPYTARAKKDEQCVLQ